MADEQTLFTQDPDTNEYVEYQPPAPKPFIETLDEELRESEHLKGVENANDLAKTFVEMKSAAPVVPENAEGYQFEPEQGQNIDPDRLATWKSNLYDLGLSQSQFEGIVKAAMDEESSSLKALDEAHEKNRAEAETALQTKWGDKYAENVDSAIKFRDAITQNLDDKGEAFVKFLEDTKFGDNPQVVEFFAACSKLISADAIEKGSPRPTRTQVARSESGQPMLDNYPEMDRGA